MSHGDASFGEGRLPRKGLGGAIVLVALFAIGAVVEAWQLRSLQSPAVWGHLRAGVWMIENHAIPRTALFSQSANLPWRDFSWGFDLIAGAMYKVVDLRAIPGLVMGFRVVLAVVLFLSAGGSRGSLWAAEALTAVGLYALSTVGPVSTSASVVLLGVELLVLTEWRRQPDLPVKAVLPVLFLVWANLDIGFVYGIAVLVIFVASVWVQPRAEGARAGSNGRRLGRIAALVLLGCVVVSGITPYGYASYFAFWRAETSAANPSIPGYAAMGFREVLDFVVLLVGMSAFLGMGLKRSRDVFLLALLGGTAALAFHSERENWVLIVSAITVIGRMAAGSPGALDLPNARRFDRQSIAVAASSLGLVVLAFFAIIPRDANVLLLKAGKTLPVKACDYIRRSRLPKPIFNSYAWGAFLTWYLPDYPVAIDGRRGLYSEQTESDYFRVMRVDAPYQSFPAMSDARTILLEKSNVVAGGLKNIAGFETAYEDDVAIVLLQGAHP